MLDCFAMSTSLLTHQLEAKINGHAAYINEHKKQHFWTKTDYKTCDKGGGSLWVVAEEAAPLQQRGVVLKHVKEPGQWKQSCSRVKDVQCKQFHFFCSDFKHPLLRIIWNVKKTQKKKIIFSLYPQTPPPDTPRIRIRIRMKIFARIRIHKINADPKPWIV